MKYGKEISFEIIVRDETGRKIDKFKFNVGENKAYAHILLLCKDKYGLEPIFEEQNSVFDI